jgi:hypothetical protein
VLIFLLHREQGIVGLFRCPKGSIGIPFFVPQRLSAFLVPAPKPDIGFGKEDGRIDRVGSNPPALIALVTLKRCDDIGVHCVFSISPFLLRSHWWMIE